MAQAPVTQTWTSRRRQIGTGPQLIAVSVVLFLITRITKRIPILGGWINGFLWPVLLICLIGGVALTYRKLKKSLKRSG